MSIDYLHGEPMKYYAPSASMTQEDYRNKIEEMCLSGNYIYSRKYDGNWSRAVINQDGVSALQTRGISKKTGTYGEVQNKVVWWEDVKNSFHNLTVILGEIYLPGNSTPICLPKRSDALRLLQRVRDETHRFATSRNQNLRTKENTKSVFLELPGVGEKRALQLQRQFTTLENLASAEESAVAQCIHVRAQEAAQILLQAQQLLEVRNEKKDLQRLSLGVSGTTKEKAAEATYLDNLASQALAAAEDGPAYD